MKTSPQTELAAALRERLRLIGDETSRRDPERHMARLQAVSEKIEALADSLAQPVDPRLVHFLERRSYDKALELLEALPNANTTRRSAAR